MSQPTHEEIIDAYDALDRLAHLAESFALYTSRGRDETRELRQTILDALPSKPQPTMAEVEWDDDKHYLAEAEHPDYGKVIMLGMNFFFGRIRIMSAKEKDALWHLAHPESLTPTGKLYTLTEVQG